MAAAAVVWICGGVTDTVGLTVLNRGIGKHNSIGDTTIYQAIYR